MTFQRVCAAAEIAKGSVAAHTVEGVDIAVVHCDDGTFHAVADECPHREIPLSEGDVSGCTLECWLHGSAFDLRTGRPTSLPATEPVAVYPVEVRDGDIYVSPVPSNSNGVQL